MDFGLTTPYIGMSSWFENLGNGSSFKQHVISSGTPSINAPIYIESVDFDDDGDLDMVATEAMGFKASWFENLGNDMNFIQHTIVSVSPETETVPLIARVVDLDGDGDKDIVFTMAEVGAILFGKVGNKGGVKWAENLGDNINFNIHTIASGGDALVPVFIDCKDFDNDGDIDIAFGSAIGLWQNGSYVGDEVSWWENKGGTPLNFEKHVIANCSNADGPEFVRMLDFDRDGDTDVIFTSAGPFNNPPKIGEDYLACAPPELNKTFNCSFYQCGDRVAWWENKKEIYNDDLHFEEHIIANGSLVNGAFSLNVDDIDYDGDYDVIVVAVHNLKRGTGQGRLIILLNKGDNLTFEPMVVLNNFMSLSVEITDYDGDGDKDIFTTFPFSDSILFLENIGNLSFVKHPFITGRDAAYAPVSYTHLTLPTN